MSCVAYGCNNRTPGKRVKKVTGLSFHRFPKDTTRRAEWVKAVRRADWTPSCCSIICSEHFNESDFERTPFRTYLKPNAVPSIFKGFPKWLQKKPSTCCKPVSSSLPTKQGPSEETLASCIKSVGSTNEIAVDQNKSKGIYRKSDCDKNTVVIVSDTDGYKNVLNGPSDANRRIVVSDKLNLPNGPFALIDNVGSAEDKVVVKNQTEVAPTFSNHGKNDLDKSKMVICTNTPDYKNVLDSNADENRRIVVSDQLIPNNRLVSSLANIYQSSSDRPVSEVVNELIGMSKYAKIPLLLVDDRFYSQRIKDLEEVVKILNKKKKIWVQKIRRTKKKLKMLRNKYIRFNKKNPAILPCNSQPMVHFLALDAKNV